MRFDFSHKAQVTQAELEKIEGISQDWVRRNVGVYARELALPVAQKIYSLRAVFGESYPDPVRVVETNQTPLSRTAAVRAWLIADEMPPAPVPAVTMPRTPAFANAVTASPPACWARSATRRWGRSTWAGPAWSR